MAVTIDLSPEAEKKLQERAAQAGQSPERFLRQLVEREVLGGNGGSPTSQTTPPAGQTFDDVLAPLRQGWQESGLADDEVDQLFNEALRKVRRQKRQDGTQ